MALILRHRRRSPPQRVVTVDWGNPITRGLRAAVVGGQPVDLVAGMPAELATGAYAVGPKGVGRVYNSASSQYDSYPAPYLGTNGQGVSLLAVYRLASTAGVRRLVSAGYGAGAYGFALSPNGTTMRAVGVPVTTGSFANIQAELSSALAVGPVYTSVGTAGRIVRLLHSGRSAENADFMDGVKYPAGTYNFRVSADQGAASSFASQTLYLAACWDRELSTREAQDLEDNPWQLFAPIQRRIWVPVASGGGATHDLTGASSSQPNAASAGAITQVHALAAPNASQPNAASAGSISQAHALIGANATQSNAASTGAVVILGTIVLTGANGAQANTASSGAITQAHALAGSNATQANSASTGAITQAHGLTGSNAAQPNAASTGAVVLGIAINLAAANSTQANAGTSGAIAQAHQLVAAPSVQDHIASASAIVQAHMLAGANAVQANAASAGAVVLGEIVVKVLSAPPSGHRLSTSARPASLSTTRRPRNLSTRTR